MTNHTPTPKKWDMKIIGKDIARINLGYCVLDLKIKDAKHIVQCVNSHAALVKSLKNLSFQAQTSGGTAGPDKDLMKAIDHAGMVIDLAAAKKGK